MGFMRLFWGMLFMFDFRVGGFDILPDIIGYILIFLGLRLLEDRDSNFNVAKKFTYPLLVISILDIFQTPQGTRISLLSYTFVSFIISIVSAICFILLIYYICMGISYMAKVRENYVLDEMALKRWKYFFMVQIISMISMAAAVALPGLLLIIFLPLFIGMLVVLILLMGLFKRASVELID